MIRRIITLASGVALFWSFFAYCQVPAEEEINSKVQTLLVFPQPDQEQKIWGTLEGPFLAINKDNDTAIRELISLGDQAVDPLVKALREKNSLLVKRRAIVALGEIRDSKATATLVDVMLDESIPDNFGVAESLAQINDPGTTELLLAALSRGKMRVRILKALDFLKDPKAAGPLFEILLEDEVNGWIAAEALGKIKDSEITSKLIALSQNRAVRANAILALGETADPLSIDALVGIISRDKDPQLREKAAIALGKIRDKRAIEPLLLLLTMDPEPRVRAAAAYALGEIKDPRATAPLTESLQKEKDDGVKTQAAEALKKLKTRF